MADQMIDMIDFNQSTEVEFEEFYDVLTGRCKLMDDSAPSAIHSLGHGRSIREIRQQFNVVDEDGGGSLDQEEIGMLAQKMGQGLKKRHLLDAMKAMDPAGTGEVSFESFKNWLVDTQDGRHWSDFLVLPEGAVAAVRRQAAHEGLLPAQDGPKSEWQRLSVLLKLLWAGTEVWGSPTHLYGLNVRDGTEEHGEGAGVLTAQEKELEAMAMSRFFHPNMPMRTIWDLVQVVLLLYLLVIVPMRISFGLEVNFGSVGFWWDASVDVYFIADIFLNFRTGFYDARGHLVIDFSVIARSYMRGWFVLDFITCLPVSYIVMLVQTDTSGGAGGKSIRVFKVLRLLKLGKLLRVARIVRILDRYQEELRVFMDAFGGVILSLIVFLFCHLIACTWYYVGTFDVEADAGAHSPALKGWVNSYFDPESCTSPPPPPPPPPNATSACVQQTSTQDTRYITSIYWSMMTISTVGYGDIPVTTDIEKIVAITTMLFGALVFAAITGQLSSRFMATMGAEQAFNTRMDEVRQYLRERNVPTHQRRSIEAHFQLLWGKAAIYDEVQILSLLPNVLSDPILHAEYTPMIAHAAIFSQLDGMVGGHEVLSLLARRLTHTVATPGLVVMREGDYGSDMYFIAEGEVDVFRTEGAADGNPAAVQKLTYGIDGRSNLGMRLGRLGKNAYFGEQAVMRRGNGMKRGVRTRSVVTRNACKFHVISKATLDELRAEIPVLNGCVAKVENFAAPLPTQTTSRQASVLGSSGESNALAEEVRALSTKLDMALNAIAELGLSKQQKH